MTLHCTFKGLVLGLDLVQVRARLQSKVWRWSLLFQVIGRGCGFKSGSGATLVFFLDPACEHLNESICKDV